MKCDEGLVSHLVLSLVAAGRHSLCFTAVTCDLGLLTGAPDGLLSRSRHQVSPEMAKKSS